MRNIALTRRAWAVAGAIEDFAPMLIGEDPTRIEFLYHRDVPLHFPEQSVINLKTVQMPGGDDIQCVAGGVE
ncbi:MAG: hypothetical protein ACUVRU_11880 [Anaerolineae bacterium]